MCAELSGRGKTRNLKKHPLEASSQSRKQIPELGKKREEREKEKRQRMERREGGLCNAPQALAQTGREAWEWIPLLVPKDGSSLPFQQPAHFIW